AQALDLLVDLVKGSHADFNGSHAHRIPGESSALAEVRHHAGRLGGTLGRPRAASRTRPVASPNAKPPMCAKNAVPPPDCGCRNVSPPDHSCRTIQMPRNQTAGISRMRMIPKKISVSTRARGRRTKYAPSTPAIAPLAPMFGTLAAPTPANSRVTKLCTAMAAMP